MDYFQQQPKKMFNKEDLYITHKYITVNNDD